MENSYAIDSAAVERRFDRAARTFDDADFLHALTRDGLIARLQPMTVEAGTVVDLGCGTGAAIRPLAKQFRGARIIGVDRSQGMLERCRSRRLWFTRSSFIKADARELPFADHSVDVVFSNLLMPWIDDLSPLAREVSRILRKDGLFAFSTLGPDTLGTLRDAWAAVDDAVHVHRFIDMHDVGDSMARGGLRDPVLDVDRTTVTYEDAGGLFRDLAATGARNALSHRRSGLTGRQHFERMRRRLEASGKFAVDVEIVYGHCWGSGVTAGDGTVRIDAGRIPIRQR
ncbi:MAG: methyltransferase domain-containing protein [Woeseiaceae bacterium]|nr:methyltransferase domain-containing protein [Woeseiaceae bacterium]